MKKLILLFLLTFNYTFAGLVNAIAVTVNDKPITLYDIDELMLKTNKSKDEVVRLLIDEKLYEDELENRKINVDIFDVNNYIEKLAAQNGMDIINFKSVIRQQYSDYNSFVEQTKKRLQHQKLVASIVRGNIKFADESDLKIYYNSHKENYNIASKIEVVQYISKNKNSLLTTKANPLQIKSDVKVSNITLRQSNINTQLKYIINSTKVGDFTPVITANNAYVMFYIKKKKDTTLQSFDEVKNQILNIIMKDREDKYLKEYFDKLKLIADIKIIR